MNKLSYWEWTLKIKVQASSKEEAIEHIKTQIKNFVLRGESVDGGKLEVIHNE